MIEIFRKMALSFPNAVEKPHFEKTSFRVKEKIFATLAEDKKIATLKLSKTEQGEFCSIHGSAIYPVHNKWGEKGWTFVELKSISEELIMEILTASYNQVNV